VPVNVKASRVMYFVGGHVRQESGNPELQVAHVESQFSHVALNGKLK
jgi:hypothetical protein